MSAVSPLKYRLQQGDMKVLDELVDQKALPELLRLLMRSFDLDGVDKDEPFRKRIVAAIVQFPGYASYIGDHIERVTEKRNEVTFGDRSDYFHLLGCLGTPEAMEQAERFLWDERIYEASLNLPIDIKWGSSDYLAAATIYRILQKQGKEPFKLWQDHFLHDDMVAMKSWWKSDASLPFRAVKQSVTENPPPTLPQLPPQAPAKVSQPVPLLGVATNPWALVIIVFSLVALLTVYLSSKRRVRRER